jgi:hypothetical protein
MLKKSISIYLVAMLLIGMAAILPVKAVTPNLYIDPAANTFYSNTTFVGDTFTVDVKIADVTNMYAYEFKLKFEYAVINLTSAVRPAGHFLEPVDPTKFVLAAWNLNYTQDATYRTAYFGFSLVNPEAARSGSGILATLTFKVIAAAPWMGSVTSAIDLFGTKLADNTASPIDHTATDGTYEYNYAPPPATHYLSVNPTTTVKAAGAPIVGTANAFFDIYVDVNNLNYEWWIVGIEFKLAYNDTLIDFISATVDPWVDGFGDIYMVSPLEAYLPDDFAYLLTAVVLMPHSSPPSHWNNPISGTGHLMKLTFEVIYQEAFPWYDSSKLDLFDCKYSDIEATSVPGVPSCVDGLVRINGFVIGRQIDMYTQWPAPYGGQSPNMPSDMFWPQKQVELYANVTYNLWPEQNKIVAFEIHNPAGEIVDIITAISDDNGTAHTSFRIPWPCFNTSALFGIWNVIATVDIACVVVNDTMQFHFDYMIEWIKVTTYKGPVVFVEETDFAHLDTVRVVVEFQSYAIQVRNVTLAVVIHDELNYPIGKLYKSTTVGDEKMELWCQYANYTEIFDIPILKWAHAGEAEIRVNALEGFPWYGYSAWTPETNVTINILPE